VIAATPFIRNKFIKANANTINVCNYPLLAELEGNLTWQQKTPEVCYVGGLHRSRGIINLLRSIGACRTLARLTLCGSFESSGFEREVRMLPQWELVNYQGSVGREQIRNTMSRAMAGLVTLPPCPNYLEALPVKMFEYMSAGIPVIASDFPLWRAIVADSDCGLLVNPLDPKHIAGAIDELLCNPERACRLGQNGRKAVEKQYNWEIEEQKLLGFYEGVLGAKRD
jgi:glycosyltransferase involved in cell wall biosynthesis